MASPDQLYKTPVGPLPNGGNLAQQPTSANAASYTSQVAAQSAPPIPTFLVPFVGLLILAVLATTSFFKPVAIILVGIIALWIMNG